MEVRRHFAVIEFPLPLCVSQGLNSGLRLDSQCLFPLRLLSRPSIDPCAYTHTINN